MRTGSSLGFVAGALALVAGAAHGLAQYDREGRYVPSPLGIPADPYARPIPNYSGKPGDAKGTPIWPRGTETKPLPGMLPRPPPPTSQTSGTMPRTLVVPLEVEDCEGGWSKDKNIPRVEFNRRCRVILRKK